MGQQILIILIGPPVMAALWWLGSRGFGGVVQGGSVSERTKSRQKKGFWILLAALYALGFAIMVYSRFRQT
jgi:hypothetical protein